MEDGTKNEFSLEETMKMSGYESEHINFCNMLLEILETSGKHLGHTVIAELLNVTHYAHLMTLVHNDIIVVEDLENPEVPSVMRYSAMFAENIMNTAKAAREEDE
ncbi:hypothetical protein HN682_09985 [Candidatus Peregrinibacteria bacterium]|jgi:hypothetical protein|nr:hypothetical protein [Candidatus Peregrinibacteria bacterium]